MFGKKKTVTSEKVEENQGAKPEGEENAPLELLFSERMETSENHAEITPEDIGEEMTPGGIDGEIPGRPIENADVKALEGSMEDSGSNDAIPEGGMPNSAQTAFGGMEFFPLLQDIQKRLGSLEDTFQQKLMRTAQEEKILDSMHEELQKYRADLYANQLRPVLSELCNICDSIIRNEEFYREKARTDGVEEPLIPLRLLADYVFDLQDLMVNNNVLVYRTEKGTVFDPAKHRVIKKVKTEEEDLHGKIAESQSNGYLYCGRTLSPEKVSVYYFEKSAERAEKAEGEQ